MNVSFVIYFCSQRIENLKQTLRFLNKRENLEKSEVLLICQDECDNVFNYKLINLKLDLYHKTKMCNVGVELAKNQKIVLLDSDRILPHNYFEKTSKTINQGEFISTWKMFKLKKQYSDDQIEKNEIEKIKDFKSKENKTCSKNLFAGHTFFFKKDYQDAGGMDESFIGYGFADTDMTKNIMSKDYKVVWNNEEEIHLFHENIINFKGESIDPEIMTALNSVNYFKKWNISMDENSINLLKLIIRNKNRYSDTIKEKINTEFGFDIFSKSENLPMKKIL